LGKLSLQILEAEERFIQTQSREDFQEVQGLIDELLVGSAAAIFFQEFRGISQVDAIEVGTLVFGNQADLVTLLQGKENCGVGKPNHLPEATSRQGEGSTPPGVDQLETFCWSPHLQVVDLGDGAVASFPVLLFPELAWGSGSEAAGPEVEQGGDATPFQQEEPLGTWSRSDGEEILGLQAWGPVTHLVSLSCFRAEVVHTPPGTAASGEEGGAERKEPLAKKEAQGAAGATIANSGSFFTRGLRGRG
jgi:hypothetical protein